MSHNDLENNNNRNGCHCQHIKGINCDVTNCAYHDQDCCCTAGEITVGPNYANSSADTVCATFKPKEIG